jgi:hypothetical protein
MQNFAIDSLGIIFAAVALIFAFPVFMKLLVTIGPLWLLVGVVAALFYLASK